MSVLGLCVDVCPLVMRGGISEGGGNSRSCVQMKEAILRSPHFLPVAGNTLSKSNIGEEGVQFSFQVALHLEARRGRG